MMLRGLNEPLKIFCGYDPREMHGFHVFVQSLLNHATIPVQIIPLRSDQRDGSNAFTYARFLIPHFCDYRGAAIFMDGSDMLVRADIAELAKLIDPHYALQVVQHDYKTRHPRKYIGTEMECANDDYPRKNWSSLMIFNLHSIKHHRLTPKYVASSPGSHLHRLEWCDDHHIGELPAEWNVLVGEQDARPDAKIAHFTLGIPHFEHYRDCDYADEYRAVAQQIHGKALAAAA